MYPGRVQNEWHGIVTATQVFTFQDQDMSSSLAFIKVIIERRELSSQDSMTTGASFKTKKNWLVEFCQQVDRKISSKYWLCARAATGPSTFLLHASQMVSSLLQLFLLPSHSMALTGESKNPNWIAREIEIFSIFAWLVPTLVLKHYSRFWVFCSTICWTWWSINIFETFGQKKIAVSLLNLVSAPCSETRPNLRTLLFVDHWL